VRGRTLSSKKRKVRNAAIPESPCEALTAQPPPAPAPCAETRPTPKPVSGTVCATVAGCKFRRQVPLGPYFADFACMEKRLIVELDGGQHAEQADRDAQRSAYLRQQGFTVLRFWNDQVLRGTDVVLEEILRQLD